MSRWVRPQRDVTQPRDTVKHEVSDRVRTRWDTVGHGQGRMPTHRGESMGESTVMLQLSIAGTLGRDAELREAGSSQVLYFSVAVSGWDRRKKEKLTTWVKVSVRGQRGEQLRSMLTKGKRVACSGSLEFGSYEKDGETVRTVEITAQDVTLLGDGAPKQESSNISGGGGLSGQASARSTGGGGAGKHTKSSWDPVANPLDDDIPFIRYEEVCP